MAWDVLGLGSDDNAGGFGGAGAHGVIEMAVEYCGRLDGDPLVCHKDDVIGAKVTEPTMPGQVSIESLDVTIPPLECPLDPWKLRMIVFEHCNDPFVEMLVIEGPIELGPPLPPP